MQSVHSSYLTFDSSTISINDGKMKDAGDEPVVDLLQIYPGKTNNLDILTFQDLNVMESRRLCCCLRLQNYEQFMIVFMSLISSILFAGMGVMVDMFISSPGIITTFWGTLSIMAPFMILLSGKLYVLGNFILFQRKKDTNSLNYHRLGSRFYYSFYSDAMFSLIVGLGWFIGLAQFCIGFGDDSIADAICEIATSFDDSITLKLAPITWLGIAPVLIYSIAGYFLVYRNHNSDFEVYYKNWAYRQWNSNIDSNVSNNDNNNDVKYMINYNYTSPLPKTHTILCRTICARNCICCHSGRDYNYDTYSCCCPFCNNCQSDECGCCCGKNCCSNGVKCSLYAISIWSIFASIFSLYFLFIFFGSWGLGIFIVVSHVRYHVLAGYYGIRLINYRFKCCPTARKKCCNSDVNRNGYVGVHVNDDAIEFYDLSIKATKAYAALAGLYYYMFLVVLCFDVIVNAVAYSDYLLVLIFMTIGGFISWLPFEVLKLIDTFIKTENFQRKQNQNSARMDAFDFKKGRIKNGANNITRNKNNDNIAPLEVASQL